MSAVVQQLPAPVVVIERAPPQRPLVSTPGAARPLSRGDSRAAPPLKGRARSMLLLPTTMSHHPTSTSSGQRVESLLEATPPLITDHSPFLGWQEDDDNESEDENDDILGTPSTRFITLKEANSLSWQQYEQWQQRERDAYRVGQPTEPFKQAPPAGDKKAETPTWSPYPDASPSVPSSSLLLHAILPLPAEPSTGIDPQSLTVSPSNAFPDYNYVTELNALNIYNEEWSTQHNELCVKHFGAPLYDQSASPLCPPSPLTDLPIEDVAPVFSGAFGSVSPAASTPPLSTASSPCPLTPVPRKNKRRIVESDDEDFCPPPKRTKPSAGIHDSTPSSFFGDEPDDDDDDFELQDGEADDDDFKPSFHPRPRPRALSTTIKPKSTRGRRVVSAPTTTKSPSKPKVTRGKKNVPTNQCGCGQVPTCKECSNTCWYRYAFSVMSANGQRVTIPKGQTCGRVGDETRQLDHQRHLDTHAVAEFIAVSEGRLRPEEAQWWRARPRAAYACPNDGCEIVFTRYDAMKRHVDGKVNKDEGGGKDTTCRFKAKEPPRAGLNARDLKWRRIDMGDNKWEHKGAFAKLGVDRAIVRSEERKLCKERE